MTYDYFLNKVMDEVFDTSSHDYFVGLSTTNPNTSGITEPSSNAGYARAKIPVFNKASRGTVSNGAAIVFPATADPWGTITDYVIFDAMTGGNPLFTSSLKTPRALTNAGSTIMFGIGELELTLVDAASI